MCRRDSFITFSAILTLLVLSSLFYGTPAAISSDYPERNISVIIPYGAGGGTDTQARIFMSVVEKILGKPVIIVNKPGAKGEIGNTEIAKSKNDGYHLGVLAYPDSVALEAYKSVDYRSDEYVYIASYTKSPVVLIVQKDSKFKNVKDFVDYAKANPGEITVSMAADAHTLAAVLLEKKAGIKITPVFYKSGSAALNGLLGKHVDAALIATQFGVVADSQDFPTIGVAGDERVPKLPDSPTFLEQGYDIQVMQSRILAAPKGTPQSIVEKLQSVCDQSAKDEGLIKKIENLGEVYHYLSGQKLEKYLQKTNAEVIQAVKENKDKFIRK
jgi:tripartite-type tricarboxylate transporter receptor subunit TctC